MAEEGKSNDQILNELDALSHTLYQAHTKRRTASLALPRSAGDGNAAAVGAPPPTRRLSMSPFRSRPKVEKNENDDDEDEDDAGAALPSKSQSFTAVPAVPAVTGEKKGIWGWKPMRALSRVSMRRMGCLFSVEVVAAQGLPASMNGLRLAVAVRKKETRDGAVQTMPSRVQQGAADFEETLFVRSSLYCSGGGATGKPLRFEPRPFLISAVAVEAPELDFGRNAVDLSLLVKESAEKSQQGERVRQWDMAFPLAGKAKGGELVVKLAFQIMDDGGVGLYTQPAVGGRTSSPAASSSFFARNHSKSSFSIASPKQVMRSEPALIPSKGAPSPDLLGIDDFKLDEPSPPVVAEVKQEPQKEPETEPEDEKADESEFPEFDIVDKGVEGQEEKDEPKEEADDKKEAGEDREEEEEDASAAPGDEVVKEVVLDSAHTWRLNELEAITNQIKALEHLMHGDVPEEGTKSPERQEEDEMAGLDADEEEVTREFLMLLEQGGDEDGSTKSSAAQVSSLKSGAKPGSGADATCYISDLGKGLSPVIQTRDGGYLAAMNPFDIPVERKELPKLAMQLSRPFILRDQKLPGGGAEVFQRLCAGGSEALFAKLDALISMDDVVGKTAEQIAFEGMASAIISARTTASSSAAQSVSLLRTMSVAMSHGRQDRIATGIWNAQEAPVTVDEILAFALQKIESMAIEALKVQADMADEQAPFEVSPEKTQQAGHLLDTAVPPEEWPTACAGADVISLLVVVQLRDPLRRYEAIGSPSVVIIQAVRAGGGGDDEPRFKAANLHLGGLRLKSADRRNMWDGEKQRLTAMHWLVAYGLGKAGRKNRAAAAGKAGNEVLWSMSSRVMADMWLKPLRNPDVKISQK